MRRPLVLVFVSSLFLSGCGAMLMGAGAVGSRAVSRDYIEGETDKNLEELYNSALKIVGIMGQVETKFISPSVAKVSGKIESASVEIDMFRLTRQTLKLRVKSRKNLMSDIELAQKVYNNILSFSNK